MAVARITLFILSMANMSFAYPPGWTPSNDTFQVGPDLPSLRQQLTERFGPRIITPRNNHQPQPQPQPHPHLLPPPIPQHYLHHEGGNIHPNPYLRMPHPGLVIFPSGRPTLAQPLFGPGGPRPHLAPLPPPVLQQPGPHVAPLPPPVLPQPQPGTIRVPNPRQGPPATPRPAAAPRPTSASRKIRRPRSIY